MHPRSRDPRRGQAINPLVSYMPLMKLIRSGIITGLLVTFIATILIYPKLPDKLGA